MKKIKTFIYCLLFKKSINRAAKLAVRVIERKTKNNNGVDIGTYPKMNIMFGCYYKFFPNINEDIGDYIIIKIMNKMERNNIKLSI